MRYSGINHVALATNDMDKTIRFWRDLLGMRLIAGIGGPAEKQYFFEVSEYIMISFFEWSDVEPVPDKDAGRPVRGPFIFDHLCIEMPDEEDLWGLKDRLESADVWVTEVIDNGFIYSMFSTDPNNIQLEFCCSVKGISISDNPKMIDTSPSSITQEGPEPISGKWPSVEKSTPLDQRKIYPGVLKKLIGDE